MIIDRYHVDFTRFTEDEILQACGPQTWNVPSWLQNEPSHSVLGIFAGRLRNAAKAMQWPYLDRINLFDCAGHMLWYALMDGRDVAVVEDGRGDLATILLDVRLIEAISLVERHEVKRFLIAAQARPPHLLSQSEFEEQFDAAYRQRTLPAFHVIDLMNLGLDVAAKLARPLVRIRPAPEGDAA